MLRPPLVVPAGRHTEVARGVADLYLDLDIRTCGPFDFHAVDIGAEVGYDLALPRLAHG
jgi:hypothetical protein